VPFARFFSEHASLPIIYCSKQTGFPVHAPGPPEIDLVESRGYVWTEPSGLSLVRQCGIIILTEPSGAKSTDASEWRAAD
jgi:hypothetical protein